MKHFIFIVLVCLSTTTFAQSEKYVKTMQEKLAVLDTTRSVDGLKELAHTFERIAKAEKTEWLPYYYAALANINMAYNMMGGNMGGNASVIDPITDKTELLVAEAEALSKNNPEIFILKKMMHSLRFMVDPQSRYMQYAPLAQAALEQAKTLDPQNPRIYLLEGQDKFYTPEQYGGSKTEAKKLFELANQKFDTFKPASALAPTWGKATAKYFLTQTNK